VRYAAFDLLYQDGDLLLDEPLEKRRGRLEEILPLGGNAPIYTAAALRCESIVEIRKPSRMHLSRVTKASL